MELTRFEMRAFIRRKRLMLLLLANIVAIAFFGSTVVERVQLTLAIGYPERIGPPMLIIAHRGDVDRFPENTLPAIKAAALGPADGIEFDVHRSADGEWYVIHDTTLDRTTDLTGWVSSHTSTEIDSARIDGGRGFRSEHRGLEVPRLTNVLDTLRDYEGMLILDLQHARTGEAGELALLLEGHAAAIIVRGPGDVAAIRAVDSSITVIARSWIAPGQVDGLLLNAAAEATIRRIEKSDLPVWVYVGEDGFDDELRLIRRAWAGGAHAFLSKHPELAMATVADLNESK